ncbi:hypothetical protein PM3016_2062 [Paenibacillus mucilaginosus 3016]|uniref:Uncharacterized protein n=1 Tax=Paenibacillus mucilaginosus 3016 TaxID=1116391 RepID=H6NCN1_9BACL|nr:hypothetical protein PM3016_2062 [Paenibacillus mucilaginosus 3016]
MVRGGLHICVKNRFLESHEEASKPTVRVDLEAFYHQQSGAKVQQLTVISALGRTGIIKEDLCPS